MEQAQAFGVMFIQLYGQFYFACFVFMYCWELCYKYNVVTYHNPYACNNNCLLVNSLV